MNSNPICSNADSSFSSELANHIQNTEMPLSTVLYIDIYIVLLTA